MNNKELIDHALEMFVPIDQIFPPVSDWHSANTYATFGQEFKDAYYNDKSRFKDLRGKGKGTGLAVAYGGSEYTVSENLGIPLPEADLIVLKFKSGLPTFTKFAYDTIKGAKTNLHVKDIFGRYRYLPLIVPKKTGNGERDRLNRSLAKKSERLAINAPIQMSGATQVKLMTINGGRYIEENNLHSFYGNNITKSFCKHIISKPESKIDDQLESFLDSKPNGNIQVVFTNENGLVSQKYDRLVQLTHKEIISLDFSLII